MPKNILPISSECIARCHIIEIRDLALTHLCRRMKRYRKLVPFSSEENSYKFLFSFFLCTNSSNSSSSSSSIRYHSTRVGRRGGGRGGEGSVFIFIFSHTHYGIRQWSKISFQRQLICFLRKHRISGIYGCQTNLDKFVPFPKYLLTRFQKPSCTGKKSEATKPTSFRFWPLLMIRKETTCSFGFPI